MKKSQPWAAKNLGAYSRPVYGNERTRKQTLCVYPGTIAQLQAIAREMGLGSASCLLEQVGRGKISVGENPKAGKQKGELVHTSLSITPTAKRGLKAIARSNQVTISAIVRAIAINLEYTLVTKKNRPEDDLGAIGDDGDEAKPHPVAVVEKATGEDYR